jgi:hypothetical protein
VENWYENVKTEKKYRRKWQNWEKIGELSRILQNLQIMLVHITVCSA